MINQDKWISSLPKKNIKFGESDITVDNERWINTIPKKNPYPNERWINTIPKKNPYPLVKRYSLMSILFVFGLLFVSAVKNETRNLEKEINNLKASNEAIKFNLDQAILDNEVITSPENISSLAKEYLNNDFITYKKSQIKNLDEDNTIKKVGKSKENDNKITDTLKKEIIKEIKNKKTEIRKLQALYDKPENIPGEIKTKVVNTIEEKKTELKNLYSSPKQIITLEKAQKWVVVQVAKLFLGMPIIPGR